jgi:hypothetical protein
MTLAAAAEGQIPEGVVEHLFRLLRRRAPQENFNLFINWLKHPSADTEVARTPASYPEMFENLSLTRGRESVSFI